jgi:nitrogen fixation protein NifU and related proteins
MPGGTRPSSAELQAAYQDLILDHYRKPRNRGRIPGAEASAAVTNPLCGDEIEIDLAFDGERVRDARFEGRGCSIAQASASMLTELVRGKTRAEVRALRERVRAMLTGGPIDETLGPLVALSGVARFPTRVPCALMAWDAAERALGSESS